MTLVESLQRDLRYQEGRVKWFRARLLTSPDYATRDFTYVLNAQAELTTARKGLITARASKMIAAFALLAASGRLSAEDLNLDVQIHSADGYIASVEDVWQELRAIED